MKLAAKTKAALQKGGSMEPMEPPLDPPLSCKDSSLRFQHQ